MDDLTALRGSSVLLKNTLPLYLGLDHMVLQNLFGDAAAAAAKADGQAQEQRLAS